MNFEGTQTYTLIIEVSDGLNINVAQPVTINVLNVNETPVANFSSTPNQGFAPLPVSFDASESSDPDGDTLSYAWNFGDGSNDTGKVVSHTYTIPGIYTATLTVDDGRGLSSTSPATIVVNIGLKVQYKVRQNENKATDNHIRPFFQIVNIGDKAVPYNELTIRYWYTRENANYPWASDNTSQQFWCDYAALGTNKVNGKFVNLASPLNGADYYLEVAFNLTSSLAAGKNSGEIQTRFNNANWSNFNEVGDYSYDPAKTNYADWTHITLYRNGQLIWGAEPQSASGARIANAQEEIAEVSDTPNDWIVYPNPSTDGGFTIEINYFDEKENPTLQVMDIQGKQVIHERLKDRVFRNSQKLNSGLYFIRITKSNVTSIKKIVVR